MKSRVPAFLALLVSACGLTASSPTAPTQLMAVSEIEVIETWRIGGGIKIQIRDSDGRVSTIWNPGSVVMNDQEHWWLLYYAIDTEVAEDQGFNISGGGKWLAPRGAEEVALLEALKQWLARNDLPTTNARTVYEQMKKNYDFSNVTLGRALMVLGLIDRIKARDEGKLTPASSGFGASR